MAGPTMKATELLRCSDTDFDENIKHLGMKGLLDTISVLQKEMSREQENFNSLSSELSSLKRNSQQYKQIQREMTASQSKLTSLMNRSMKCFQQQGNQHIHKGQTTPATTDKDSSSASIQRQNSAQVDGQERDRVKSPITSSQVKSTPNISSEVSAMPVVLKPVSNSQEIEKPDDKKVKMTSSINIKPQLSSSQPIIVSGSKNNSLSIDDSVPKSKSSILTVNMNKTAKSSTSQHGTLSQKNTENGKDESGNSKDSNVSSKCMQNGEEKRHSSSIQVIPIVSETGRSSESLDCKSEKSTVTAKTIVQKTNTPTVVYQGNRPYLVDQNLAQNRETMLDQIRNFQRKTDSVPKVVMQQDKEQRKVYESASSFKDNKNGVNEVKSENVDSGAEDGSSEPSPDAEKFVSKFTFPQKPKRDLAKLEEKRKARNSDLPAQEEITLQNESEELQTEKTEKEEFNHLESGENEEVSVELSAEEQALAQEHRGVKEAEEDEKAPVRINFSSWDPSKLLKDLYSVRLMSDTTEDISDKFIAMEGLMEKLPMNKKKATLLKTWKRRFFRAKDGWLHYFETGSRDKPSDSLQLMGGKVDDLGNRILGIDDGRGRYLMVRCPTDKEYGQWKLALESQTADNVKATYVRPALVLPQHPEKNIIIIDIGSSAIRAGILGEQATLPKLFFPSTVARNKKTGELITGIEAYTPEVRQQSELRKPVYPTEKVDKFGIDIETIDVVFKKIFTELGVDSTKFWVMISTPQNLGDKVRAGLMTILIDQFHVKGVCMSMQALLALYSYNATSGIIVDIGERMEILPIYDGYVIEGGVSRQSYGGQKVAESLKHSLEKYKLSTPIQQLLVRYVMEQSCYVTSDYKDTLKKCEENPDNYKTMISLSNYDLPEGADITVTHDYSCFKSPEGFFNTDLWGMDYPCVHKLVFKAIQSCPMDGRKRMYRAVYLSGGVTLLPGFAERLQLELSKLAPPSVLVEVHSSPNRYHSAFIGACSLANMEQFQQICISSEEWKKDGVKAFKKWNMTS